MSNLLDILGSDLEHDSRHWFPSIYEESTLPLPSYFALALSGEVGELCNFMKKVVRDGADKTDEIGAELADILVYTLLLARSLNVDMDAVLQEKRDVLVERWGPTNV